MAVTTVILAGGQGRRMGGLNKALLTLGDEAFIERQIRVASESTDEIIVVSNDLALHDRLWSYPSVRVIPDHYVGEGPLAGLHAGLASASHPLVWLLGCDQPNPHAGAARLLIESIESGSYQAALPVAQSKPQPLHAIYRKEVGGIAESLLKRGERRFLSLLERIPWCRVEERQFAEQGIPPDFANDVDTPEQYEKARQLFSKDQ
jgi:molybdopterin-guanine dinucleotide biosynthesis protein A